MKKIFIYLILGILLIGFTIAINLGVEVTLNSPANGTLIYNNSISLNCSVVANAGTAITNASILWDGSIVYNKTPSSSNYVNEPTNQAYPSSTTTTNKQGYIIYVTNPEGTYITNISVYPGIGATRAYILNGARAQIAIGNITGDKADFTGGNNFVAYGGVYYIEVDAAGGTYTQRYGGPSFPIVGTNINYIAGVNGASNETGTGFAIMNITTLSPGSLPNNMTINYTKTITSSGEYSWTCRGDNNASGYGIAPTQIIRVDTNPGTIILNYPSNETTIITNGEYFNVSFNFTNNSNNYHWINSTYYIWNINGSLFNKTTISISGNSTNSSNLFMDDFSLGNYLWNNLGCYGNAIFNNCQWSNLGNYSFTYNPFVVHSENYSNYTIMGSYEYFEINLSVIPGYQISYAYLNYNGTKYNGILSSYGTNSYLIKKNLSIPGVISTSVMNFNWEIIMQNGASFNSSSHNQTVFSFGIDNCSAYTTKLFIFNLVDEDTQELINGTTGNSSIETQISLYSYDRSILFLNYSTKFTKLNPVNICLSIPINNSYYSLDSTIKYSSEGRIPESYNLQNFILRNSSLPQNITFYDLLSSRSTEFLITYKDAYFLPVENAIVEMTRQYLSEGVFKTIEIPKTDKNGQAIGHFVLGTETYRINVIKNGEVLAIFDNVAIVCENPTYSQCKLNLNAFSSGNEFTDYSKIGGISYSMSFNQSTRIVLVTFTTLNGGVNTVNVTLKVRNSGGSSSVICSDQLISSAGTLTCTVPVSYGNVTIISQLYSDGSLITTSSYSITPDPKDYFGGNGIVFVLLLSLTIPFIFISDKIGFLIGTILGVIISGLLVLYTQGSVLGVISPIIWLIIVGGVGIWKLSQD